MKEYNMNGIFSQVVKHAMLIMSISDWYLTYTHHSLLYSLQALASASFTCISAGLSWGTSYILEKKYNNVRINHC